MVDKNSKHTKNGLVQESIYFNTGFKMTISIATGISGESSCIVIRDNNIYPDSDSRSERHFNREYIIPIDFADDLRKISDVVLKSLKQRKKTMK